MPPRKTPPVLDHELIARRMAAKKLSKRALARQMGWTHVRVSSLLDGANHAQLDVYELVALARTLDLELHELFLRADRSEAEEISDDAVRVHAVLTRLGRMTTRESIAHGLQWPAARVDEAIAALRAALNGTALRLTVHNGRVGVVVAESLVSDDEMRRVYLRVFERESLANDELTMLKAIAVGLVRSDHERTFGAGDRVSWLALHKYGLVDRAADGTLALSARVQFSLRLIGPKDAGLRRVGFTGRARWPTGRHANISR
jgi:transcriptional regulator with XRE-family HTH domain